MNLESLKTVASSKMARQLLVAQKHSPKALFVAGVVGVVGATVLACRATLKVGEILDGHEKLLRDLENVAPDRQQDLNKDLNQLKIKTAATIAYKYLPAVALGVVSIAALTGSHVVLSKRNTGLMAAYAGLDKAYKQYRQNVVEKYGTEEDRKFVAGARNVHVEEKLSDGKTKIEVKSVGDDKRAASPFAVLFDEQSHMFSKAPGMNANTIILQQEWANTKLRARGHLFLNEVHDMLGLPRTKAGAMCGWVWRRDSEEKTGDNFVDFGVYHGDLERAEAFVDGTEDRVWLDFNVDGVILDLI